MNRLNLWEDAPHVLRQILNENPNINANKPLAAQLAQLVTNDERVKVLQSLDDPSLEGIKYLMNRNKRL